MKKLLLVLSAFVAVLSIAAGTHDSYYYIWKIKKGKMALERHGHNSEGKKLKPELVTPFEYDADFAESFADAKKKTARICNIHPPHKWVGYDSEFHWHEEKFFNASKDGQPGILWVRSNVAKWISAPYADAEFIKMAPTLITSPKNGLWENDIYRFYFKAGEAGSKGVVCFSMRWEESDGKWDITVPLENDSMETVGLLSMCVNGNFPHLTSETPSTTYLLKKGGRVGMANLLWPDCIVRPVFGSGSVRSDSKHGEYLEMFTYPVLILERNDSVLAVNIKDCSVIAGGKLNSSGDSYRVRDSGYFWKNNGEIKALDYTDGPGRWSTLIKPHDSYRWHIIPPDTISGATAFRFVRTDTLGTYLTRGEKVYFYNALENKRISPVFKAVDDSTTYEGYVKVTDRGGHRMYGFPNASNSAFTVVETPADMLDVASDISRHGSTAIVRVNGSYGLYDSERDISLPAMYDSVYSIRTEFPSLPEQFEHLYVTERNGFRGYADLESGVIQQPIFDLLFLDRPSSQVAFIDRNWGMFPSYYQSCVKFTEKNPYAVTFSPDSDGSLQLNDNFAYLAIKSKEMKDYDRNTAIRILEQKLQMPIMAKAMYYEALHIYENASDSKQLYKAKYMLEQSLKLKSTHESYALLNEIINKKTMWEKLEEEEAVARQQEYDMRRAELLRQQEIRRQQQAEAWGQLAQSLGQMAQGVNNAVSAYKRQRVGQHSRNRYNAAGSVAPTSMSQSPQSPQYTPTQVLEIWVSGVGAGQKRVEHRFHNWYKRFYGNRWCIFTRKDGKFHTAVENHDKKCEYFDVSQYRYKAIDPKVTGGTKYYYFD